MEEIVLSPAEFVTVLNQTLEFAYPGVIIEGELSDFRISKNRWVYFNLKDEQASVAFFGTIYQLPGPLEDGLRLRVAGMPRLHPRYGFSVSVQAMQPVGAGSIKKAADLLCAKLEAEGLFAPERKRALPAVPKRIGLITAANSAAAADFIKILGERWGGIEILLADSLVQGDQAPGQIVQALDYFNKAAQLPDVLVITRGGGSLDDLAAFNDERVVRAVASSRIPTLVAIGHEVDVSLAELAADVRASTPTNAAGLVAPDRQQIIKEISTLQADLTQRMRYAFEAIAESNRQARKNIESIMSSILQESKSNLQSLAKLVKLFDPQLTLKRGYAIVNRGSMHISRVSQIKVGDKLGIQLVDGRISATTNDITKG